jgi:hypothetical protein
LLGRGLAERQSNGNGCQNRKPQKHRLHAPPWELSC